MSFEQAAWVFFDPFFRLVDASRNDESRDAVIGRDEQGRLLYVVHVEVEGGSFASFPPARQPERNVNAMIPEHLKKRLDKNRPMTSITLRIPVDVVESLKEIAPRKGFSGYQTLLKAYIGEGLRRDEAEYVFGHTARLIEALKKRGVPDDLIEEAAREAV